jgi:hypothetical protein
MSCDFSHIGTSTSTCSSRVESVLLRVLVVVELYLLCDASFISGAGMSNTSAVKDRLVVQEPKQKRSTCRTSRLRDG